MRGFLCQWAVMHDLVVFQRGMMLFASSAVSWATCQSSCSAPAVGSITMATVSVLLWRSSPLSGLAGNVPTVKYVRPAGQFLSLSHTHTHTHICMYTHTHTYTHVHTHIHTHTHTHTLTLTHTHIHSNTHTLSHTHIYAHTHTHTHINTHTHTCTHTH